MRTITTVCFVLLMSCGGSSPPRVDWPAVAQCAAIPKDELFGSVQAVLLDRTTDPTAELERLAGQHGPHVIACLVDQAVQNFAAMAAAPAGPQARQMSAEPEAAVAAEATSAEVAAVRGRDFLQRVGTTVEGEAP
jgi:hypothetical protein